MEILCRYYLFSKHGVYVHHVSKNRTPAIFGYNFSKISHLCMVFGKEDHKAICLLVMSRKFGIGWEPPVWWYSNHGISAHQLLNSVSIHVSFCINDQINGWYFSPWMTSLCNLLPADLLFRLHREMQTVLTNVRGVSVCLSCSSSRPHSAKMAEQIKILFGVNTLWAHGTLC